MRGVNIVEGDLVYKDNDFEILDDDITVAVERTLTTNLGEFFLDLNFGGLYEIFTDKTSTAEDIKREVRKCIYQVDRVKDITDMTIDADYNNRTVNIKFKFITYNDEEIEGGVSI